MNVFEFRNQIVSDYAAYIRSFININDPDISARVEEELRSGLLWPEPLIQLNPFFTSGETIDQLVQESVIHPECSTRNVMEKSMKSVGHISAEIQKAARCLRFDLTFTNPILMLDLA